MNSDVAYFAEVLRVSLSAGLKCQLRFEGTSMLPTLTPGTMLEITAVTIPMIGAIYVYLDEDVDSEPKLVCHRLVSRENGFFVFRGDNRRVDDPKVSAANLIGEVCIS